MFSVWNFADKGLHFQCLENSALSFHSHHVPELCVGKKNNIPLPPHPVNYWRLYIPLADWPVGHMIDWLLPVGGGFARSTHAYKHAIRIHWCQNQFIILFTNGVGGLEKVLFQFEFRWFADSWLDGFYMSSWIKNCHLNFN